MAQASGAPSWAASLSGSDASLESYPLAHGHGRRMILSAPGPRALLQPQIYPRLPPWLTCSIQLCADERYQLVRRLLAGGGARIRAIHEATGAKLRIRGRGSGHREGWMQVEAPEPLMLVISSPPGRRRAFREAVWLAIDLLCEEESNYARWLGRRRLRPVRLFNFGAIHRRALPIIRDLVTMFW